MSWSAEEREPKDTYSDEARSPLEGAKAIVASKASPEPQDDTPAPDLDREIIEAQHAAADSEPFPLAEPGEYYIGLWGGKPNYGCPYCGYATLEGPGAVELHILERIDRGNQRHLPALKLK